MNLSSLHDTEVEMSEDVKSYEFMASSRDEIIFRLRVLPAALNMSVGEIAKAAGVSPTAWSNYLSRDASKNTITWESALELSKSLGIPMEWVYDGDYSKFQDSELRLKVREAERQARRRTA